MADGLKPACSFLRARGGTHGRGFGEVKRTLLPTLLKSRLLDWKVGSHLPPHLLSLAIPSLPCSLLEPRASFLCSDIPTLGFLGWGWLVC